MYSKLSNAGGAPKRKQDNSKALNIKKLSGKDTGKFIETLKNQQ